MTLDMGEQARSNVIELESDALKKITVTVGKYEANAGSPGKIWIRGRAGIFGPYSSEPHWELYKGSIEREWKYVQVRVTKG